MADDVTKQLSGTGVSPGVGIGPIARLGSPVGELPPSNVQGDPEADRVRATRAFEEVGADLDARAARANGTAKEVVEALAMMARDPALHSMVEGAIDGGKPAAYAVDEAIGHFRAALEAAGGYLAERAADLGDLRNRIVARLLHLPMPGVPHRDEPFVLVADDLAPADTVDLDPAVIRGLVTEHGGPTSHTAIIAKALGIPAIVGCGGILALDDDTVVIVDGSTGEVTASPAEVDLAKARQRQADREAALANSSGPGRTSDGHAVKLLLNHGGGDDVEASNIDSEGIGLLRTEFLFLDRQSEPTMEEQVASYKRVLTAFGDRRVVVRTLDVGADKPLPFVPDGPGDNPALGLRGWRLTELAPGVVERQMEALATAAEGLECELWVMAPMVATVQEAADVVALGRSFGLPKMGVMVEIPSLAVQAKRLMEVVDFVSLGTNDLSQYALAADRMVSELGGLLNAWQPALLSLIAMTASAGEEAETSVGVCGEAASDPLLARVLVGMGCTSLSMSAGSLPEVRASLAAVTLEECRGLARTALAAADPATARAAVAEATKVRI